MAERVHVFTKERGFVVANGVMDKAFRGFGVKHISRALGLGDQGVDQLTFSTGSDAYFSEPLPFLYLSWGLPDGSHVATLQAGTNLENGSKDGKYIRLAVAPLVDATSGVRRNLTFGWRPIDPLQIDRFGIQEVSYLHMGEEETDFGPEKNGVKHSSMLGGISRYDYDTDMRGSTLIYESIFNVWGHDYRFNLRRFRETSIGVQTYYDVNHGQPVGMETVGKNRLRFKLRQDNRFAYSSIVVDIPKEIGFSAETLKEALAFLEASK